MKKQPELVEAGMRIRFANEADLQNISEFIKNVWDAKYSYATHPDLLRYIHSRNSEVWYVVLENVETKELLGTMGYILCNDLEESDVAVTLLKEKPSVKRMMGIKMLLFLHEHRPQRVQFSCGIRKNTINIYEFLQWNTAKLDYYYRIADRENYRICNVTNKCILPTTNGNGLLKEFVEFSELQTCFNVEQFIDLRPYKDMNYLKWRYYDFPYYKYRVWGIETDNCMTGKTECTALLVGREIEYNGSKMLTIVDFVGEEESLAEISTEVQRLMDVNNYEYIEFMCYGLKQDTLNKAGFVLRKENDENILPSHFEPYACENVDKYFFTTDLTNIRMFRADSNQDVPRYITQ